MFSNRLFEVGEDPLFSTGTAAKKQQELKLSKTVSNDSSGSEDTFWLTLRQELEVADNTPDEAREHPCDNCGKLGKSMRCKTCKQAYFCSQGCRREYEPFHQRFK